MSNVTIRVRDNGPLLVEGPVQLLDVDGKAIPFDPAKPSIALCRCGASNRKPFCDGSHKTCQFDSVVRAPAAE
jgi:CDGSH iron-sulfur domain-containing protein 3